MKLYLDTTVISFLFATDAPTELEITKNFFEIISKHDCYISDTVLEEIEKSPSPKKEMLKSIVKAYKFKVLKITDEIKGLAAKYVEKKLIPKRFFNDGIHIAVAVVNNLDAIVSWNLEHIVKLKTEIGVNKINKELNYPALHVCTPEEVLE